MSFSSEKRRYTHGSDAERSVELYEEITAPLVGLSAEELKIARNTTFWKFMRYSLFIMFWLLWAGFLAGTTVIVVLNNGDVTTTVAPTTVHQTRSMSHQ